MKNVVEAQAQSWQPNGPANGTIYWKFQILQSGSRLFLEVTQSRDYYGNEGATFTVELQASERQVQVDREFFGCLQEVKEDLYRQMADMVKTAQGLWQPKFQPGDVVMVDKVGSPTIKIIDPATQTSEQIEKRQVTIEKDECSCGIRTLLQLGCARKRGATHCEAS